MLTVLCQDQEHYDQCFSNRMEFSQVYGIFPKAKALIKTNKAVNKSLDVNCGSMALYFGFVPHLSVSVGNLSDISFSRYYVCVAMISKHFCLRVFVGKSTICFQNYDLEMFILGDLACLDLCYMNSVTCVRCRACV